MPRVTISEPGKTPQPYRFKLERKIIKIGRGSDNDIVIECGSVSTNHCTMERVDGGYILRDTGSTNGIKQEDTLMQVIDLFDGMKVLVGDVPMKFQLSDNEIEQLSEEEFTTHQKKKLPPAKDDEPKPRPVTNTPGTSSPRTPNPYRPQPIQDNSSGPFKTLVVFILVIVAIFAGMTIRHNMRTGDFLPTKLMGGSKEAPTDPNTEKSKKSQDDSGNGDTPESPDAP